MPVRFAMGARRSALLLTAVGAVGAAGVAAVAWSRASRGDRELCATAPRDEQAWDYLPTLVRADLWRGMSRQQRRRINEEWRGLGWEFFCVDPGDEQAPFRVIYRRRKDSQPKPAG